MGRKIIILFILLLITFLGVKWLLSSQKLGRTSLFSSLNPSSSIFNADTPKQNGKTASIMILPVFPDQALAGNEEILRTELRKIKDLNVNIVMQAFLPSTTQKDWQSYLDTCQAEGFKVIPFFGEKEANWQRQMSKNKEFLKAMKNHPALYALFLIDEPFHKKHNWEVTTKVLRSLYLEAKKIAPRVPILVQFSREIALSEQSSKRKADQYRFEAGLCDICQISALEFRNYGEGNIFDKATLLQNQETSRKIIQERSPNSLIFSSIQVFGGKGESNYYMPSPQELEEMISLLFSPELESAGKLNGVMWQRWKAATPEIEANGDSLSDSEFSPQREIVKNFSGK